MAAQRIELLGVPLDILKIEDIEKEILELTEKQGPKQIVFLNIWGLLKARGKSEYARCVKSADLVIPVSKSILSGAKFLKKTVPVRHNQFSFVISMLSALENHYKSLYLLGGKRKTLSTAEQNVKKTFKNLQILGRCVGNYKKVYENEIVTAIFKAAPSLALISEDIRDKDCWSFKRTEKLGSTIFLYYRDIFGIFSNRIKRVSDKTFDAGMEIWVEILRNPFKVFLVFPYIYYLLCLLFTRLFRKGK